MSSKGAWLTSAVGIASVGAGVVIGAPYMIAGGVVGAAITGTGAIIEGIRSAKQRKMFKACEIYKKISDDIYIYPSIISNGENYMLIDLPNGMGIKDVTNKHSVIESYYGRKVIIEQTTNKKIVIKMLEPGKNEEDRWLNIFNNVGVIDVIGDHPRLMDSEINRVGQKVIFSLPANMTVRDFQNKQEQLEYALKCKVDITEEKYKLQIQTITRVFKELYTLDFRENILQDMQFIVGVGRDGENLIMDLGGNEFSTLVCGASGSGKSVFLNCLLVQFILKEIEIYAIDLKAVEFKIFKNYKKMSRYATNRKDAVQVLADAYDLMQDRYSELEEKNCKSYSDYNKNNNNSMPPVLVIVDEYSVLMDDKKAKFFLFELLSRCRASNILMIICTQTPRAKILDGTIRCNLKNTVCFSVETDSDSEVALGQKGNFKAARELKAIGRGFLKSRGKLIEFQGYFLEDRQIEKQIKSKIDKVNHTKKEEDTHNKKVIPIKHKQSQDIDKLLRKIEDL